MTIGGITYPTTPFTGWYVAPELSARDFSDEYRYNLLPEIAEALGIDTSDRRSLWQDRAVIEMTTAVLHSYDQAGMRMDDHYTATEKFHKWFQAEERKGHEVQAEWTWMIPPISASLTSLFHQECFGVEKLPNFVASPRPQADEPGATRPFTGATLNA
jgi:nitric-oxide synthase